MAKCFALSRATSKMSGVGIHHGIEATVRIRPHLEGIHFEEPNEAMQTQAVHTKVTNTMLRTVLNGRFETVEHLVSSLWGMNIPNAMVVLRGREVPIMDGSALPFVHALKQCPLVKVEDKRPFLVPKISLKVESSDGNSVIEVFPSQQSDRSLVIDLTCEFDGNMEEFSFQRNWLDVDPSITEFETQIAAARTFVSEKEIPVLHSAKLGLGGRRDNCLVFQEGMVMPVNAELRFSNERARHKMLDLIGDFSLLGHYRLVAKIRAKRPGHSINFMAVKKLMENSTVVNESAS